MEPITVPSAAMAITTVLAPAVVVATGTVSESVTDMTTATELAEATVDE
ncbi:MAG: hypothetical protein V2I33_16265 [Kangiellaceae bacterium]|jgi:hypothetical protein|nr:hypothetical protein [Kangiellaceae bacterium]